MSITITISTNGGDGNGPEGNGNHKKVDEKNISRVEKIPVELLRIVRFLDSLQIFSAWDQAILSIEVPQWVTFLDCGHCTSNPEKLQKHDNQHHFFGETLSMV